MTMAGNPSLGHADSWWLCHALRIIAARFTLLHFSARVWVMPCRWLTIVRFWSWQAQTISHLRLVKGLVR
jgi:hypothetical protein